MLSARYFLLSYKKKFVTKFVTCITKFVTRVSKFVTSVTKFVTKNILADSKKLQGERKNFHGDRKIFLGDNSDVLPGRSHDDLKNLYGFALFLYDKKDFGECFREN